MNTELLEALNILEKEKDISKETLLDAIVERFGKKGVSYSKLDDDFVMVMATVEVSDPFFGWLTGFGRRVKLLSPDNVVERYKAYLDKIRNMYE